MEQATPHRSNPEERLHSTPDPVSFDQEKQVNLSYFNKLNISIVASLVTCTSKRNGLGRVIIVNQQCISYLSLQENRVKLVAQFHIYSEVHREVWSVLGIFMYFFKRGIYRVAGNPINLGVPFV